MNFTNIYSWITELCFSTGLLIIKRFRWVARCQIQVRFQFFKFKTAEEQCQSLTEPLYWTIEPVSGLSCPVFKARVADDFVLNLESCLLVFPSPEASVDVLCQELRNSIPGQPSVVTLVITTDSDAHSRWQRLASVASNFFVVPDSRTLTEWLLSPLPAEVVSRLIASQVRVTRVSPYQTAGGVDRKASFVGREQILGHILNRDPANYFLAGARQSGKSSLLKEIRRQCQQHKTLDCHYVVLSENSLASAVAREFGIDLAECRLSLRESTLSQSGFRMESNSAAQSFRGAKSENDLDEEVLRRLQQRPQSKPCWLLLDEVDAFISRQCELGYSALHRMRALSEEGRCYFILAGYWTLYETVALDSRSPLRNFGEVLEVGPLEADACRTLATKPMQGLNIRYESEVLVEHLIQVTGQRANLIATACNDLLQRIDPTTRVISGEQLAETLDSNAIQERLAGWEGTTDEDRGRQLDRIIVYATLAQTESTLPDNSNDTTPASDSPSFTLEDVLQHLKRLDLHFAPDELRRSLTGQRQVECGGRA